MASFRPTRRYAASLCATALVLQALLVAPVRAEPVLISVEAQGAMAISEPQSALFGPGGVLGAAVHSPIAPALLLGLRVRAGLLSDGEPPEQRGVRDPGLGSFQLVSLMARLRPFATARDVRRTPGLFVDLGAGGGVTGHNGRPAFEAGLGFGFALGAVTIAPVVRYLQVWQPTSPLASADARVALLGIEMTLGDAQPAPLRAAVVEAPAPEPEPEPELDRDDDSIVDTRDTCPEQPEDRDGHRDDDGCPDPDNDGDGIADGSDKCPEQAEDKDTFEDEDGCPESDNDRDSFPDADDQCPNEAEVVNGNEDYDGCPDAGEIVFENGRIVLEERVLFDFQRVRVKHAARPILKAIMKLRAQHPEWISVHIEGHADARGNARVNQTLSDLRARNVMKELIKLGIPAEQISAEGYGATRLRDQGVDEAAHQRNRRVEFVVETRAPVLQPGAAAPDAPPVPSSREGRR